MLKGSIFSYLYVCLTTMIVNVLKAKTKNTSIDVELRLF